MPKDRFQRLVGKQVAAEPRLPGVHATDAYRFVDAVDADALMPRPCKVFPGEPLLYLFYGRPSYRVNQHEEPSGLAHYLPVCVLLRSTSLVGIKQIFPFDTGAFSLGRYDHALHRDMGVLDFALEPDPSIPGRVVSLFFGSVSAYVNAHPQSSVDFDQIDFEARAYHALISQQTRSNADDRLSAIELQLMEPMCLSASAEAVIAPGPLLESPRISDFIEQNKIVPLPYDQLGRQRPSEHVTSIFRLCYDYYRRLGLIP